MYERRASIGARSRGEEAVANKSPDPLSLPSGINRISSNLELILGGSDLECSSPHTYTRRKERTVVASLSCAVVSFMFVSRKNWDACRCFSLANVRQLFYREFEHQATTSRDRFVVDATFSSTSSQLKPATQSPPLIHPGCGYAASTHRHARARMSAQSPAPTQSHQSLHCGRPPAG